MGKHQDQRMDFDKYELGDKMKAKDERYFNQYISSLKKQIQKLEYFLKQSSLVATHNSLKDQVKQLKNQNTKLQRALR